jgi:hypothetical protein
MGRGSGPLKAKKSDTGALAPLVACAVHSWSPKSAHLIEGCEHEDSSCCGIDVVHGRLGLPCGVWWRQL